MQHQFYSLSQISEIVNGRVLGSLAERQICDLLIDSRQLIVPDQALFFALVSARNDGHKYIKELYDKGVRAFVVKRLPEDSCAEATFIQVADTLKALQTLAAYHRRQFSIPVIGITGSNGKTLVKEWLFQLLSPDFNIVRSPKSYNSQVGVPLSLWQMSGKNELAIFEAGISEPDEMTALQDMIRPTVGVFTNIGQAHDENFINRVQKAGEKLNLFTKAEQLVYCMDYADIQQVVIRSGIASKVRLFTWSRKFEDADLFVRRVAKTDKEATIECVWQGNTLSFAIPFADDASVENAIKPEYVQGTEYVPFFVGIEIPTAGILNSLYAELEYLSNRDELQADADAVAWTVSLIKKIGKRSKIQLSAYSENEVSDVAIAARFTATVQ